jgi:hypothetical protein
VGTITASPPARAVGRLYRETLRAALSTTPYQRSVGRGRLPRGLRVSRHSELSGVPTHSGWRSFEVAVTEAGPPAMSASHWFEIVVGCPGGTRGRACHGPRKAIHARAVIHRNAPGNIHRGGQVPGR